MKRNRLILIIGFWLYLAASAMAQSESRTGYRNFPLVLTLQFHNLATPFHDITSNFSNIGIGIGTEISLNGNHNWAQQFSLVWYRNKAVGNGILVYTQSAWRPTPVSEAFGEIKAGIGYLYAFRPTESYKPFGNDWISVGHKGRGMLAVPVGVSLGYDNRSQDIYATPFASYQLLIVRNYNSSIPLVPETLIQAGSRIHLKYD